MSIFKFKPIILLAPTIITQIPIAHNDRQVRGFGNQRFIIMIANALLRVSTTSVMRMPGRLRAELHIVVVWFHTNGRGGGCAFSEPTGVAFGVAVASDSPVFEKGLEQRFQGVGGGGDDGDANFYGCPVERLFSNRLV